MRFIFLLACCGLLCGCGSNNADCTLTQTYFVSPQTGTADHSATGSGKQVQFTANIQEAPPAGCSLKTTTDRAYATWTSPDPLDISISNASDSTNGLVTCNGTTNGAVSITATTGPVGGQTVSAVGEVTCH